MEIRIVNTIIYCEKFAETVNFYRSRLNLAVTTSLDWFVEFKLNEYSRLSIANEKNASIKSSEGRGLTITLQVHDIDETFHFLKEAGVNPGEIKKHAWGAKIIHVFDPEGNRIEFWSQNI